MHPQFAGAERDGLTPCPLLRNRSYVQIAKLLVVESCGHRVVADSCLRLAQRKHCAANAQPTRAIPHSRSVLTGVGPGIARPGHRAVVGLEQTP